MAKIATLVRGGDKNRAENHGNFCLCQDIHPTTNNLNNLCSNNCRRVFEECAPAVAGDLERKIIFFPLFQSYFSPIEKTHGCRPIKKGLQQWGTTMGATMWSVRVPVWCEGLQGTVRPMSGALKRLNVALLKNLAWQV
jgi:hypothetical protein